jgi:ketosteroid isomerase-like protein
MAPSANEEIASGAMAAFSRGEIEDGLATLDPEIEWHLAFRLPDLPPGKAVFRGLDEVRELWIAFRSVWDELVIDWEEVEAERGDTMLVRVRFRGRGGTSGVEVDRTIFYVLELRDQKLVRSRPFEDRAEARAASGIGDG